ncbi:MAG: SMC-Scp complex subunit ScpB [Parachlamydiaceae bacterium]|nr:SMC-Scp complex subunit ScpB [Parachlamydiaceae bacterium]
MSKEINLFISEMSTDIEEEMPTQETSSISDEPIKENVLPEPPVVPQINSAQEKVLRQQIKRIIEAILFSSSAPVTFEKLRQVADTFHAMRPKVLRELIQELQQEYMSQQRAFRLEEIAQGFILRTCEEFSPYIESIGISRRGEKLSHPAAEVLAIIAYRQPITRPQIDAIRGVDSSGTIYNLLERQLIEPVGKLEAPGRPTLYGITKTFLEHFGLKDLKQLPPLQI